MSSFRSFIAAAVLALVCQTGHATPTLNADVVVHGGKVFLTDLFDGVATGQDRAVMASPRPGESATLNAATLARFARSNGLAWTPATGTEEVHILRASLHVSADELAELLRPELIAQMGASDVEVKLDNPRLELNLPSLVAPDLHLEGLTVQPRTGRFSANLAGDVLAGQRVLVTGQAIAMRFVPVLNARLTRGQVIGPQDVTWLNMRESQLSPDVIEDVDGLIGMAARRPISPQMPVRNVDVAAPLVVKRNEVVVLRYRAGGLLLTAKGRVQDNGGMGDVVNVLNSQSKRIIQGVVAGPQLVDVESGMQIASR
jgi:flagellar basal body P-ring formation protein FlgA